MKIIVLGADGYLGWPTCMHLANLGNEVIAVDNYLKRKIAKETSSAPLVEMPSLPDRADIYYDLGNRSKIKVYEGDLANFEFMSKMMAREKPDAVIHYAEQPSGPYSMIGHKEASLTLHNNVGTTLNLIHAVMEHCPECHIIKLGTMGEYGTPNIDIEEGWIDITHNGRTDKFLFPRQAGSFYHTTKILDTDIIWFYVRMKGLRVTDLMQGPVYSMFTDQIVQDENGLGTHFWYDDIFGTALNRFVVQAIAGIPMTVYGKGGQTRGYLNIRDTMQCVTLAAENPAEQGELRIMNQFTEDFSANALAEAVQRAAKLMGIEAPIDHIKNPRIESEDHYYNAKLEKFLELGLKPTLLNDETIVGMLQYVSRNKDRIQKDCIMPRVSWKSGGSTA